MPMPGLQELLHKLEEGSGGRYLKAALIVLAVLGLMLAYDLRCYRNMSTIESMDNAQLARNLAEGHGYTTSFIRPLSIYYLQKQSGEGESIAPVIPGTARLKDGHPDLVNPPVYPALLAGLFKASHISFEVAPKDSFWNNGQSFWWYGPDFIVTLFNEVLFLGVVVLSFLLARRLFEPAVAWVTALVMLGTEVFWRFSNSGLSTMLLMLLFLALCWCLVWIEAAGRDPGRSGMNIAAMAAIAGVVLGIGGLTRYSFAWLLVPVAVFLILFSGTNRVINTLAAVLACLAVMSPWVVRNMNVSGLPFGLATLAVVNDTGPGLDSTRLERSLTPDYGEVNIYRFANKFRVNLREIVADELPKFAGSWVSAFFLVGLLLGFINPAIARLRYFLVGSLIILCLVQALGRTYLSTDSPGINSENLIVLLAPLILMYGVSFFYVLLEQMQLPFQQLRLAAIGLFVAINSIPLMITFMPPRIPPHVYPPYYPPTIQEVGDWMKPDELVMSDIPWAVAWYGRRQCIWLTMDADEEFYKINDYQKQIRGLYLTPKTLDSRFLSDWIRSGEHSWGSFVLSIIVGKEVPKYFPLRRMPAGFMPEQLFVSDRQRW